MSIMNETNSVCPYSLRAFQQQYQEHGKRCHGLGDLNMTNKQNKQNTFLHRQIPTFYFLIKKNLSKIFFCVKFLLLCHKEKGFVTCPQEFFGKKSKSPSFKEIRLNSIYLDHRFLYVTHIYHSTFPSLALQCQIIFIFFQNQIQQ